MSVRSAMFLYAAEWIWQNESVHLAINAHTTYFPILILIRMPHMDQLFLPYLQCHAQNHRITASRKESHSLICNFWLYFTTCCKWHSMYKNYILSKRLFIFCTMLLSANHSSCVCDISVPIQFWQYLMCLNDHIYYPLTMVSSVDSHCFNLKLKMFLI